MNFTFKTTKPTGRYRSFGSDSHVIKLQKKEVGTIEDDAPYKIRLMIIKEDIMENGNPNCIWKWITLKKESLSLQEAKDFLKANYEQIVKQFKLYLSD